MWISFTLFFFFNNGLLSGFWDNWYGKRKYKEIKKFFLFPHVRIWIKVFFFLVGGAKEFFVSVFLPCLVNKFSDHNSCCLFIPFLVIEYYKLRLSKWTKPVSLWQGKLSFTTDFLIKLSPTKQRYCSKLLRTLLVVVTQCLELNPLDSLIWFNSHCDCP